MNSINSLETERKKKIRNLSIHEVKEYIRRLQKMRFKSYDNQNKELADFYTEKLKEVFYLFQGKFTNLVSYADDVEIGILYSNLIIDSVERKSSELLFKSAYLLHIGLILYNELEVLKTLIELNNDDLSEVIDNLTIFMLETILAMQSHIDYDSEELLNRKLADFEIEKKNVIEKAPSDDRLNQLKEDNYFDKLQTLSEAYKTYDKQCKFFNDRQIEVLSYIRHLENENVVDLN